jgi:hypothetical protein
MKKDKAKESKQPNHWAQCFLEHAARETAWMREHGKNCDYLAAHTASVRRDVWLHAALLAQEKRK